MDVGSAIRINELAKELSQKGIAQSSEEASKMAEQFLSKNISGKNSLSMPEGTDKLEIYMERMQRRFNSEITSMQEKMNAVVNKLNSVCDEIQKLKGISQAGESVNIQRKVESREPHHRTGNFRPGDIDINKFFYAGKK